MKKREMLLFTTSFPYGIGEKSFLLPEIDKLSIFFDITIISKNIEDEQTARLPENIKIIRYNTKTQFKFSNLIHALFDIFWIQEVLFLIKSNRITFKRLFSAYKNCVSSVQFFDFLKKEGIFNKQNAIYYSYWYDQTILSLIRSRNRNFNSKIITRMHRCDLYENNKLQYLPYIRQLDKFIDKIVFISEEGKNYYLNNYKFKENNKYLLSYLGTEKPSKIPEYGNYNFIKILSCSYISPVKRIDKIINVISNIKNYNVVWDHIGNGILEDEMKTIANDKLYNKENIDYQFLGYMDNQQVRKHFENNYYDLFINLSSSEGLPVTFMESMSFSLPVISNIVGGVGEILNGCNSILVDVEEQEYEIAKKIEDYYKEDINVKLKLRKEAYNTWENKFDAGKNHKQFAKILCELI